MLEGLVLMKLGHLKGSRVLPLGVAIVLVKLNSMIVILWNFIPILVAQCHAIRLELVLIDHPTEFFVSSCNVFKPLPAIKIKQVVLAGIDCTGDQVISSND